MSRDESRRSKRCRVDRDYEMAPGSGILVNDYDDERTLDEEEELEPTEDTHNELSDLQKESELPIKDLLAMYGYNDIGNQDENKENEEDEEEEEDEDDEDDEDEEDDEPAVDLQKFYTDMHKGEENAEKLSSAKIGNSDRTDDAVSLTPGLHAHLNTPSIELKPEGTHGVSDVLPSANPGECTDGTMSIDASNPDAPSSGIIGGGGSGTSRLLRSVSRPQSEEEEDDCDYSPDEEEWKKTIMVGSDYQAAIPEGLCRYDDALPYENEDKMLWDPIPIQEEEVKDFLEKATSPAVKGTSLPSGYHLRDDEQALYLLVQCGYSTDEALRRRRMNVVPPSEAGVSLWSEEECHNFEAGLRIYGKDFHLIQKNKVRTRSVGELVQFYYLWKKTERHDIFTYKARLEKKKYALHPGITDYMDRFLEEQEGVRDRSSSPNVHGLLYGDSKRQRTNINSTSNEDQMLDNSNNPSAQMTTSTSSNNTVASGGGGIDGSTSSTSVNSGPVVDPLAVEHHHSSLSSLNEPAVSSSPSIVATAAAVPSLPLLTATAQQQVHQHQQRQHHFHQHLAQQPTAAHNHQHVNNNNNNDNEEVVARSPENMLPRLPP